MLQFLNARMPFLFSENLQYIAGELMPTPDEVEKVAKSSQEDLEGNGFSH